MRAFEQETLETGMLAKNELQASSRISWDEKQDRRDPMEDGHQTSRSPTRLWQSC